MKRSCESNAIRVRTAWFPLIATIQESKHELHIVWLYSDGTIGLYSDVGKKSKSRPPWGCIVDCVKQELKNAKGEVNEYLVMKNRSFRSKAFKVEELLPVKINVNDFTSKILKMRKDGRNDLLAMYFSFLVKSSGFTAHKHGVYNEQGLSLKEIEKETSLLIQSGGSVKELETFIEQARNSAIKVEYSSHIMRELASTCSVIVKKSEANPVRVKKCREDKIVDNKLEEVSDPCGLESTFLQNFLGKAEVPIANLEISSDVALPMNSLKVSALATGMLQRFDPTQMAVMATPDPSKPFNKEDLRENHYIVFHGRHRLQALKELENKGLIHKLIGMGKKRIMVHILKVQSSVQVNYGALRGNEIQAEYVRKPFLHELVYVATKISEYSSADKCIETMGRYCKVLSFGADDITAVRKFAAWSTSGLTALSKCLQNYEVCNIADAKEDNFIERKRSRIMKGDPIPVPNVLFRKLANVDEDHFLSMSSRVESGELSLKILAEEFNIVSKRNYICSLVQKELGFQSMEEVNAAFPGKFDDAILDSFSGSVIGLKSKNKKGAALQEYCKEVIANTEVSLKIALKVIDSISTFDVHLLDGYSCVVFYLSTVSNTVLKKVESFKYENGRSSLILIFDRYADLKTAECILNLSDVKKLKEYQLIAFENCEPRVEKNYCENMIFGLAFYEAVYQAPVQMFNGPLKNIDNVVNQISPPGAKLAFVCDEKLQIQSIHSVYACTYFGQKNVVQRFNSSLETGADIQYLEALDENVKNTNFVSTSDGIHKSSVSDLRNSDDSGILVDTSLNDLH